MYCLQWERENHEWLLQKARELDDKVNEYRDWIKEKFNEYRQWTKEKFYAATRIFTRQVDRASKFVRDTTMKIVNYGK